MNRSNEELVIEYQQTKNPHLIDELIQKNDKLIKWLASRYERKFCELYEFDDLYQLASIGMWEAASKWEDRGKNFASHSVWYMQTKIIRHHAKIKSIKNALSLDEPLEADSDLTLADAIWDERTPFWDKFEKKQFILEFRKLLCEILPLEDLEIINRFYFTRDRLTKYEFINRDKILRKLRNNGKLRRFRREWELDKRTTFIRATNYSHSKTSRSNTVASPVERIVLERLKLELELINRGIG